MSSCLWPFGKAEYVLPGHEGPNFPYTKVGETYYPMIDVTIWRNYQALKIRALVDSGASLALFRPELALYLGIDVFKGKKIILESVSSSITGYIHELKVEISGKKFHLPVAFLDQPHTSFNILGRDGFFENFIVTFDENKKELHLS